MLSNFLCKLLKQNLEAIRTLQSVPKYTLPAIQAIVRTTSTINQTPITPPSTNAYTQGQKSNANAQAREYFYYVDKRGTLFLDHEDKKNPDVSVKDPTFLKSFFDNLQANENTKYTEDFPYVTRLPGLNDVNYLKFQILPIVFTQIYNPMNRASQLSINRTGRSLTIPFFPKKLYYSDLTGLLYYPVKKSQGSMGIFTPELVLYLSSRIDFNDGGPTFRWRNQTYRLNQ